MNPLDRAIKERLHLRGENPITLKLVRALIQSADAASRALFGHPYVALREIEALLAQLDGLTGYELITALLEQNGGTVITPHGLEHIPLCGPVVIASTHPTGVFDVVTHTAVLLEKRPDLKVVANRDAEEFLGPDVVVPVTIDKQTRATSGSHTHRAMQRHLLAGGALLIFGSGRVPDRRRGLLVEPQWRRGATRVSKAGRSPIVPAAVDAQNSDAYYRLRAAARIISAGNDRFGAMIGSLRYPAELLLKLGGRYDVHYGPQIAPHTAPEMIQQAAESLTPDLYGSG